jgi:hypothetical protein
VRDDLAAKLRHLAAVYEHVAFVGAGWLERADRLDRGEPVWAQRWELDEPDGERHWEQVIIEPDGTLTPVGQPPHWE